jgi:hypothetical protein
LPSASELTVPVKAAWFCAQTVWGTAWKSITAALAVKLNISLRRICFSLMKICFGNFEARIPLGRD